MAGPGRLYRCKVCGHEFKLMLVFGRSYTPEWAATIEYQSRIKKTGPPLDLQELLSEIYQMVRARNNRHAWHAALKEAAERREFPNLLFAEKWITTLAKTGIYPNCYFRRPGD